MNKNILILLCWCFASFAIAQKTAFINETKILEATPGYKEAFAKVEELKKTYAQEVKESQNKLQDKVTDLLKNYKIESNATQEQLEALLSATDKEKFDLLKEESKLLEKQIILKEKAFNEIYKEKLGSILEKVNNNVKNYCKNNKIDVLYKLDKLEFALAYFDETKDITSIFIKN
jgi:Skp family chaperone for outer membrane proteins